MKLHLVVPDYKVIDNIQNVRTGDKFLIPMMLLGRREITSSDLELGERTITVRPLGGLRLRAEDSSGNGVPNATLNIVSVDLEGTLEAITNDSGEASLLLLQEGEYSIGSPRGERIPTVIKGGQEISLMIAIK